MLRKILGSIFGGAERERRQSEKYRSRYVAFLDTLGWKAIVDEIDTDRNRLEGIIGAYNTIKGQIHADRRWARSLRSWQEFADLEPLKHTLMSDAIVISSEEQPLGLTTLIRSCGMLSADLLDRGFLTRGAVVFGRLYHDNDVVFGKALTNAYLLERDVAKYPRVLLTDEVRSRFLEGTIEGPSRDGVVNDLFREDEDGYWRLNVFADITKPDRRTFTSFLMHAASAIRGGLSLNAPDTKEFAKNRWLAEVYNTELARVRQAGIIDSGALDRIDIDAFLNGTVGSAKNGPSDGTA